MGVEMFDNKPMQTLRQYIAAAEPSRTHEEWAQAIGITRSHFTEIVNGTAFPGRRVIERIAAETGGAVSPAVWFRPESAA